MNRKILLALLPIALATLSNCNNDDNGSTGTSPKELTIDPNAPETIVTILVDDLEVPIYLSIPEGCENQQFPAVVVMHGSNGMWSNNNDPESESLSGQFKEWQEILAQNCMVGAFVDSYSGRGVATRTGKWRELPNNFRISAQFIRPKDANAALSLLQNLKFPNGRSVVDENKIALLGFSDGASAVLASLLDTDKVPEDFEWTQSANGTTYDFFDGVLAPQSKPNMGYVGGIYYYGGAVGYNYYGKQPCGLEVIEENIYSPYAPILFQIPSDDVLTENNLCLFNVLKTKEAPVELQYYEGMPHSFDFDDEPESRAARTYAINWLKTLFNTN